MGNLDKMLREMEEASEVEGEFDDLKQQAVGLSMLKLGMLESLVLEKISRETYIEKNKPIDDFILKLNAAMEKAAAKVRALDE